MGQNWEKHRINSQSNPIIYFPTSEGVSEVSKRANEWMDERVAQCLRLYSCLFQTTVQQLPILLRCARKWLSNIFGWGGRKNKESYFSSCQWVSGPITPNSYWNYISKNLGDFVKSFRLSYLNWRRSLLRPLVRLRVIPILEGIMSCLSHDISTAVEIRLRWSTMGQNQVILRHQKFTFPRAREWAKWASKRMSERSGGREWSEQSGASETSEQC